MKKMRNFKAGILIFVIPLAFMLLFPFSKTLEDKSIDMRMRLRGSGIVDRRIVVVLIDEESFRAMNLRWPWPRSVFASALEQIGQDKPLAIGIDVEFSERGFSDANDIDLAGAMEKAGNIVIPEKLWTSKKDGHEITELDRAEEIFVAASAAQGYVNLPRDPDGFVRRVIPSADFDNRKLIPFAFAIAKTAEPSIELPDRKALVINYPGGEKSFLTISFSKVLSGEIGGGFFRDKIVLIGAGFRESGDYLMTPFSDSAGSSGVTVQASIVNMLLTGQKISKTPLWLDNVIFLLLLGVFTFLVLLLRPGIVIPISAGFAVVWIAASLLLFDRTRILIPLTNIVLMLLLTAAGGIIFHYLGERNRRREIHGIFSRFVSPAVVKQLVETPDMVQLGGEIREVALLFSDIRGFTAMSDKMDPAEIVGMLNEYFTVMTDVLFANQGTLNKFIGDAVFAFFGAPNAFENTAEMAVRTSLEMRKALKAFNRQRETQGKQTLKIGIGLHKGKVLVGNIGSARQMEYTVIGDAVNVCSRIESYTKEADADILISDAVYQDVKDSVAVETLPAVMLRGKKEGITLHKLKEGKFQ